MQKKKKKKTKKKARKKVAKSTVGPPEKPYKRPAPELEQIFALHARHIPNGMDDDCLDIDDEFPLHYATGIVSVPDNGNPFSEWLKTIGFKFKDGKGWLAVWGT